MRIKSRHSGRLEEMQDTEGLTYTGDGATPWRLDAGPVDAVFPCATQNEVQAEDAAALVEAGVKLVVEGANMPCVPGAVAAFNAAGVTFVPGKMVCVCVCVWCVGVEVGVSTLSFCVC